VRCSKCGSENQIDWKFCTKCGTKLEPAASHALRTSSENVCIQCGSEIHPEARFCGQCGARVMNVCPKCGAKVTLGAKFCTMCGFRLTSQPSHLSSVSKAIERLSKRFGR